MDESTLLRLLEEDPEQGIPLLQTEYGTLLYFAAARRLESPDDIRDCVHDTLTDFFLQRHRFHADTGSLRSYLVAIADRNAIRIYQNNRRQQLAEKQDSTESLHSPEDWERLSQLRDALACLSPTDRQILEQKFFYGFSTREISQTLGMEYEAVKKRQQRALKKLRRILEE